MTYFDESPEAARPRRRTSFARYAGLIPLAIALIAMFVLSVLPTGYVIQQPGPVVNTLGDVKIDDQTKPVIEVGSGKETYPTDGTLSLTTVQVLGNREQTPSWFELVQAWLDPSKAVLPIDAVFPAGVSQEQKQQADQAMMVDSQTEAAAAALREQGYDVPGRPSIGTVDDAGAAAGVLKPGDVIDQVDGKPVATFDEVRSAVNDAAGKAVQMTVTRDGSSEPVTVTLQPRKGKDQAGEERWLIGVGLMMTFKLPVDVKIQLDKIGGPSAGMMFALGIIDKMTPGELNGGKAIAGTGTIDADGNVGPIGGIRQKLYGARDAGAKYFIAPKSNCNEVVGHVPDGLRVYATETLQQSVATVEAIASGSGLDKLATCAGTKPAD